MAKGTFCIRCIIVENAALIISGRVSQARSWALYRMSLTFESASWVPRRFLRGRGGVELLYSPSILEGLCSKTHKATAVIIH